MEHMARILVIDDDAAVLSTVRRILERAGHDVSSAADGEAGMRMFREQPAELVVTDLYMPEKEGIETIQELREQFPAVRILAVSGGGVAGTGGALEDALLFGADGTLSKPFSAEQLRSAVDRLLAG
jgi:CheY-like chemotaxis protein